jgi:glycerol kinase
VATDALGAGSPLCGVAVSALIGDQHAALFGQACFDRGMTKATFGTGSFVLMHAGATCPPPVDGLVTTLAWDLGTDGDVAIGADGGPTEQRGSLAYALEGSVFVAGAGVQWLRDGLGILGSSTELEPLARTVDSSDGVVLVPAFTGLGSPHWDPGARGTITGLSRGTGRAHLARAMIEAMGFQVRDVLEAMGGAGTTPSVVRVDGGAAVMGLLLQHLADQTGLEVLRPDSVETTALGAATMAGLAEGVWGSLDDLSALWSVDAAFTPGTDPALLEVGRGAYAAWRRAVDRSRGWIADGHSS